MRHDSLPTPAATITAADIELAMGKLAQIMVADSEEGMLDLPIYQRLERELVATRQKEDALARVCVRAYSDSRAVMPKAWSS